MSIKVLCDICGEPMNTRQHVVKWKRESRTGPFSFSWEKLDVCPDCAFKIKCYVRDKNEYAEDFIQVIRCHDCGNCKELIDGSFICNVTSIKTNPLAYCSHACKIVDDHNLIFPPDPLGSILYGEIRKERSDDC